MAKRKRNGNGGGRKSIKKGLGQARTQSLVEGIGDWDSAFAFDYDSNFRF